jgi:hypothetical protein
MFIEQVPSGEHIILALFRSVSRHSAQVCLTLDVGHQRLAGGAARLEKATKSRSPCAPRGCLPIPADRGWQAGSLAVAILAGLRANDRGRGARPVSASTSIALMGSAIKSGKSRIGSSVRMLANPVR